MPEKICEGSDNINYSQYKDARPCVSTYFGKINNK